MKALLISFVKNVKKYFVVIALTSIPKKKHNIRNNYINKKRQCEKHKKEYYLFCNDCKLNLCSECKKIINFIV